MTINPVGCRTLTPGEVLQVARSSGLSGGAAVIAAAIAMAESGGRTCARNLSGIEDSQGLWQINVRAHPAWAEQDLSDPAINAKAMLAVSGNGSNWTPWSTWWQDPQRRLGPGLGVYRRWLPSVISGRNEFADPSQLTPAQGGSNLLVNAQSGATGAYPDWGVEGPGRCLLGGEKLSLPIVGNVAQAPCLVTAQTWQRLKGVTIIGFSGIVVLTGVLILARRQVGGTVRTVLNVLPSPAAQTVSAVANKGTSLTPKQTSASVEPVRARRAGATTSSGQRLQERQAIRARAYDQSGRMSPLDVNAPVDIPV